MNNKKTIWVVVALVSTYVICQAIADVGATTFIEIFGITMPGGTLIFALTFTLRDMVHKRLGKEWARAAIVVAALLNILLAGYLGLVARLSNPVWWDLGESWSMIFAILPAITIASIIAEFTSEMTDTEIYSFWKKRFPTYPQWSRVVVSNFVSIPLDSFIFGTLAFVVLPPLFGGMSKPFMAVVLGLIGGQVIFKAIVTIISMPLIYLVKDKPIEFK